MDEGQDLDEQRVFVTAVVIVILWHFFVIFDHFSKSIEQNILLNATSTISTRQYLAGLILVFLILLISLRVFRNIFPINYLLLTALGLPEGLWHKLSFSGFNTVHIWRSLATELFVSECIILGVELLKIECRLGFLSQFFLLIAQLLLFYLSLDLYNRRSAVAALLVTVLFVTMILIDDIHDLFLVSPSLQDCLTTALGLHFDSVCLFAAILLISEINGSTSTFW